MAQVIELPGEANPLSHENVLNAMILAASSTQQQVQTGTQQLQNWEKQEKYHSFLQVLVFFGWQFILSDAKFCRIYS